MFGCPAMQCVRNRYSALFSPANNTMHLFMWQRNIVRVAHYIMDCFEVLGALDDHSLCQRGNPPIALNISPTAPKCPKLVCNQLLLGCVVVSGGLGWGLRWGPPSQAPTAIRTP